MIAGEAKTHWTLNLQEIMADELLNYHQFVEDFGPVAGQVANYMKEHHYKYGFLTTYNYTVFFKQESTTLTGTMADANQVVNGTSMLRFSNPISNCTRSRTVGTTAAPHQYKDMVSLRECMLYLMMEVTTKDYKSTTKAKDWTRGDGRGIPKRLQYPGPGSSKKSAPSSSFSKFHDNLPRRSPRNPSTSRGYETSSYEYSRNQDKYSSTVADTYEPTARRQPQSHTATPDPLADKMGALQIQYSSQEIRVRYSGHDKVYKYVNSYNKYVPVDSHRVDTNKALWVQIKGVYHPAIVTRV
ncbi:MAG: hypothetical protein Q9170_005865 [Blastenia crenularia]